MQTASSGATSATRKEVAESAAETADAALDLLGPTREFISETISKLLRDREAAAKDRIGEVFYEEITGHGLPSAGARTRGAHSGQAAGLPGATTPLTVPAQPKHERLASLKRSSRIGDQWVGGRKSGNDPRPVRRIEVTGTFTEKAKRYVEVKVLRSTGAKKTLNKPMLESTLKSDYRLVKKGP